MRPIQKIILVVLLFYGWGIEIGISQIRELKSKQIQLFQNLPYDSGVPPVFEDSRGFIWIGSFNGLIKYDGYTYHSFVTNPEDSLSIIDNKIDCIAEDSKGNLWVGTQNGLCYYDARKNVFKRYDHRLKSTLINPRINQIKVNEAGDVLIKSNAGYFIYHKILDEFHPLVIPELDGKQIEHIVAFSKKSIIAYESHNLYRYTYNDRPIILSKKHAINESNCVFTTSLEFSDSTIYLGSTCGLFHYNWNSNSLARVSLNPGDNASVLSLLRFENTILIGLTDQLLSLNIQSGKVAQYGTSYNTGQTNFFYKMAISSNNILWHLHPFIYKSDLKFNQFSSIKLNIELIKVEPERMNYLFEWLPGKLVLTTTQGAKLFDLSTAEFSDVEIIDNGIRKAFGEIISHAVVDSTKIWIATCCGLYLIDKYANKLLNTNSISPALKLFEENKICIKKIYLDKKKNLWIATWSQGLYKLTDSGILKKYAFQTEWENKFRTIYEDTHGQIWFGTRGGLMKYIELQDTFKIYKNVKGNPNSLSENTSFSIYDDGVNNLWIGSYGGGLNKLNILNDSIEVFTTENGLIDNTIFSIYPDKRKNLWLSTFKGLSLFDPIHKTVKNYDSKNGLVNDGLNAFIHYQNATSGYIYYLGNNGLDFFHPDSIIQSTHNTPVYITGLKLFNKDISISTGKKDNIFRLDEDISFQKNLNLKYDQYVISLDYIALDYSAPENIQYAYKLENFDRDWQYVNKQRSATFTNLKPGSYIFKVKATNADGVWGNKIASLNIFISPPWWKTWWAYIIYFITIVGSILSYVRYRSRSLIIQNKKLEESVKIRTNELNKSLIELKGTQDQLLEIEREKAEQEKLILRQQATELEMQALRAQMNPHFIFNALNSINNFIQQNDKTQATDYLIKFSKLVRSVLEYSRLPLISMYQELETIKLYIELEALRFTHTLDFIIYSDPELDLVSLKVPPLILQPFVENAIYHGLIPKQENGKLAITVTDKDDYFQVEILDNGIGRKKSLLSKHTTLSHKSLGLDITINRIKLFNETGKWNYESVEIIDLEDTNQQALGTKVYINLNLSLV